VADRAVIDQASASSCCRCSRRYVAPPVIVGGAGDNLSRLLVLWVFKLEI